MMCQPGHSKRSNIEDNYLDSTKRVRTLQQRRERFAQDRRCRQDERHEREARRAPAVGGEIDHGRESGRCQVQENGTEALLYEVHNIYDVSINKYHGRTPCYT